MACVITDATTVNSKDGEYASHTLAVALILIRLTAHTTVVKYTIAHGGYPQDSKVALQDWQPGTKTTVTMKLPSSRDPKTTSRTSRE